MNIDLNKIDLVFVSGVELLNPINEYFAKIPGTKDYAFSTYGRLVKRNDKGKWKRACEKVVFSKEGESYNLTINGISKTISIRKLFAMVFLPDEKNIYLHNRNFNASNTERWFIENLVALSGKEEITESILSKIENRKPLYDEKEKTLKLINIPNCNKKSYKKFIKSKYYGMRTRAKNIKVKKRQPIYANTTISDEWLNNQNSFYEWFLENQYYYPEDLHLDKDLLGFGEKNCYCAEYTSLIPRYLNNIFTKGYSELGYSIEEITRTDGTKCYKIPAKAFTINPKSDKDICLDTYVEAILTARKKKAKYLRDIVEKEKANGFMPDKLLKAILIWANRCELGLAKIWEPSEETLIKMGVI